MYVFTRKWGSPICHVSFTDCTKHASACALIHRQQLIYWIFTQTKLSSIYRHKLYCHLLGLDETSSVAYNSGETETIIFFYCSIEIDSGEILASVRQEEGNFEVLKRCYIQIYPTSFLLCFGKAVNLQHMWNSEWSNMELLWKKQRNTTWSVIS